MDRNTIDAIIHKMKSEGLPPLVIDTFISYYHQIADGETGLICDADIEPVAADELKDISELELYRDTGKDVTSRSVMIILNGGLGTSMGLTGPKSLLEAKNGKTFLEIILEQTAHQGCSLALMNSFTTHDQTLEAIRRINPSQIPYMFLQHKFPKILQKDLSPARHVKKPELEWNPPGHGDIYLALLTSGMLDLLLDKGIHYAFIRNSDNLGATLDTALLGYFAQNQFPFMMETAQRTPSDLKGGHLARHKSGKLILREAAQCPKNETDAFRNISKYRFFNTNNLWVNLDYLKDFFRKEKIVKLPLICNPKTLDPRVGSSDPVFQIETAMGAAVSVFDGAVAVKVNRNRFFPVKKCNDLLILRSDCFIYTNNATIIPNPVRKTADLPKVDLDSTYYGMIDQFDENFPFIPSLIDCEYLKVEGCVQFEQQVKIVGRTIIRNQKPQSAIIKQGAVIEGELIL